MLRKIVTGRFKRDFRLVSKQGKNLIVLHDVMEMIVDEQPLPARYRDHKLTGNYIGRRECHLAPDWLLIYKLTDDAVIFERTGSPIERLMALSLKK